MKQGNEIREINVIRISTVTLFLCELSLQTGDWSDSTRDWSHKVKICHTGSQGVKSGRMISGSF